MLILNPVDWLKIIVYILRLIIDGMSKGTAVAMTAAKFRVSESEIWKHGGF
ncbi:MAG: hypothetical protein ABRQ27_11915 [Clostridiaceae bacterium]